MRGFAEFFPMPAEKQTPITPEGRRAAERVRILFYSIAAANLVFIAVIMWLGRGRKDPAKPAAENLPPERNQKP